MSGTKNKRGRNRRRISEGAKARFIHGLRRGLPLEDSARSAGHSLAGFYGVRRRDSGFRTEWLEALEASAGEFRIVANNSRRLQLRKMRHVSFTAKRRETFLSYFAGTCDTEAAAAAAGVDPSTVYKHRQLHPDFAAEWEEALQLGYAFLEAESLRQRIEAQQRLRDGLTPKGEIPAEFERVMKLLDRWERRNGKAGTRSVSPGRQKSWTFDAAMQALEKKLTALGYRVEEGEPPQEPGALPGPEEGEE